MTLYLIRHGQTEWNATGRYQGALDSALTPRGREQAAAVGRRLALFLATNPDPLPAYVSPLGRAQETAQIVAQHARLSLAAEPRLAEVSLGGWDGMTEFEIEAEHPGALDGAEHHDWYFRAPGGESLAAVMRRVGHWLEDAVRPAVAVSHGLAGRIIRGVYLGLGEREMLTLPVPQDGFYVLDGGRAEFVAA